MHRIRTLDEKCFDASERRRRRRRVYSKLTQ